MESASQARSATLGYLHQSLVALWLLLEAPDEAVISIESLDDISFEDGEPKELIQVKHHSTPKNLTDSSEELWKTIGIWSDHITQGRVNPGKTLFTLLTTASITSDSLAWLFIATPRDNQAIKERLALIIASSKNHKLTASFEKYNELSEEQKSNLVDAIHILASSKDISGVENRIRGCIQFAVKPVHIDHLQDRLLGWWFTQIISYMQKTTRSFMSKRELHEKIRNVADQFKPDALPIDFLDALPTNIDPENDARIFVRQLKSIALKNKQIEHALIDYYQAFQQRSRWAREDLVLGDELSQYENRLIREWERYMLTEQGNTDFNKLNEDELVTFGQKIYKWIEHDANFRIRENVSEKYVVRGSYQMLADMDPPLVWWHPLFVERLKDLLAKAPT